MLPNKLRQPHRQPERGFVPHRVDHGGALGDGEGLGEHGVAEQVLGGHFEGVEDVCLVLVGLLVLGLGLVLELGLLGLGLGLALGPGRVLLVGVGVGGFLVVVGVGVVLVEGVEGVRFGGVGGGAGRGGKLGGWPGPRGSGVEGDGAPAAALVKGVGGLGFVVEGAVAELEYHG